MVKVGIYLGTPSDPVGNIIPVLKSVSASLKSHQLELFGGASLPESLQNDFKYIAMEEMSDSLPIKIFRGYQYTRRYINRNDPDILIQLWKYTTHAPGVALAGKQYNIPTIGRFTGDTFNEYRGFDHLKKIGVFILNNIVGRSAIYSLEGAIALGPYGKSELVRQGMDPESITILPPPSPNTDQFSKSYSNQTHREDLNIPHEKEVFLYVGRMSDQKGMEYLREVITRLPTIENHLFLLVGSGPYQSTFDREFKDENVRVVGQIPHEQIDVYYKAADCYIHPSPYEGIPLVILEALACGTPVLARQAGDIGFVTDNITRTPDEMVSAILENDYEYDWKNRELFESTTQQSQLKSVIERYTS